MNDRPDRLTTDLILKLMEVVQPMMNGRGPDRFAAILSALSNVFVIAAAGYTFVLTDDEAEQRQTLRHIRDEFNDNYLSAASTHLDALRKQMPRKESETGS